MIRCLGLADSRPGAVAAFVASADAAGLRLVGGRDRPVAVAFDPGARPTIGVAVHEDGSFLVLDGEAFADDPGHPYATPDAAAAALLARARSTAAGRLDGAHLEGLVTFWDARSGVVRVARDQGGISGGLVGQVGGSVLWSSEPASLLAAGLAPAPDPVGVDQLLLLGWVTPPRSLLRDASTIPAGHVATITASGGIDVVPWFRHTARPTVTGSPAEQSAMLGEAIVRAVGRRAHGGRLGAFLSAGVDSAAVVGVVRRVLDLPIDTFTFRYGQYEGALNEDEYAAETARRLGAPHHVLDVGPDDLADGFADAVRRFQGPFTFGVHSFDQRGVQALGVDAVLTGSDPGFWIDHGRSGALAVGLRRLPARVLTTALRLTPALRRLPKGDAIRWGFLLAAYGIMSSYAPLDRRRTLHGSAADAGQLALARDIAAATRLYDDEPLSIRSHFVFEQFGVPEYVGQWNHRWGRAAGHPIRGPLWDLEVMAVADRRTETGGDKPLLRRWAEGLVGADRAHAPKIHQEVPLAEWLRGPLRDFAHDALAPARIAEAGVFDPTGVTALLDDHLAGQDLQWPLWTVLTATEWALQLRHAAVAPAIHPGSGQ